MREKEKETDELDEIIQTLEISDKDRFVSSLDKKMLSLNHTDKKMMTQNILDTFSYKELVFLSVLGGGSNRKYTQQYDHEQENLSDVFHMDKKEYDDFLMDVSEIFMSPRCEKPSHAIAEIEEKYSYKYILVLALLGGISIAKTMMSSRFGI